MEELGGFKGFEEFGGKRAYRKGYWRVPGVSWGAFLRYLKLGAALSGSLRAFAGFLGLSWRALTTFLRVCQEDLGAWGQLSDDPWEYLGMILAVWVIKMAVILRQEGTKERFDRQIVGLAKH